MVSISSIAHRAWRIYPDFVLGSGHEAFSNALKETVKNRGKDVSYFSSVYDGIKKGAVAAEEHNKSMIKQHGGFFKSLWHDIKTTPEMVSGGWKAAGEEAEKTGLKGLSKHWAKIKGAGKGLMKRMPLIGSLMIVGFELPNIFRASKDEGLISGAVEAGKAGLRLGAGMTGAAIGQALIPIPILGGLAGFIIGDKLMSIVTGKSYTEKREQLKQATANVDEQYKKALEQYKQSANENPFAASNVYANPSIPQATLTKEQVAALAQQLYSGDQSADIMNQDFMKLTSGMNGFNKIG